MGKKDFDLLIAARSRQKALKDIRKFARLRGWVAKDISLKRKKMLSGNKTLFTTQFSVNLRKDWRKYKKR